MMFIETAALLVTALVAWYYNVNYGEDDLNSFLITAAITGGVGLVFFLFGSRKRLEFDADDTYVIVTLSWLLFSAFGMLPFLLSGAVDNVTDAFFETMSGFSTAGSTVLRDVDAQTHGILFWRSVTQWLGGLGIVVFTVAFVPSVAKGSRKISLFAAEAPGMSVEKLTPTMQGTSRILWAIYILLTLSCALFYWMGPMDLFDAVCHGLTTIATGGYSTHSDSIGYFHSSYIEYVCAGFMLLSGINFSMYYFLVAGRFDIVRKNEELKVYLGAIVLLTLMYIILFRIAPSLNGVTEEQIAAYPEEGEPRFRTAFFHVISMLSNTGFSGQNSNYDLWGMLFVIPTIIMQIVGACAGSTSGGIKIVRVMVVFKMIRNALKQLIHPTGIFTVKISGQTVDENTVHRVVHFFTMFILLFVLNIVVLSFAGMSFEDSGIAFLTCFSNLGAGSGATGPDASFADLPAVAKWVLSIDMMIGRLEIITFFLVFTRAAWQTRVSVRR
ncbi:MAG: TrkH family potassium uptake protein [Bacteroidales bacterium]|nr:TrkH family potassium uptake protein [Bacteroidales bacterium]